MIYRLLNIESEWNVTMMLISVFFTFLVTITFIKLTWNYLPHDAGREFAINGQLSKGKTRGVGIVFILCFVISSVIFFPIDIEFYIYCLLLLASMLSGFLDDCSNVPWGEFKKGLIDLIIAVVAAMSYINFNPEKIGVIIKDSLFKIPAFAYVALATLLIWISINVTNCSDGVDGLSGSLSIITFATYYFVFEKQGSSYAHVTLLIITSIAGYLWYNVSPSSVLMGDAGSRAIGFLIGILALKTYNPFLYILVSLMLVIDGGIGLIKLTLIRITKKKVLMNIRTPIHDHVRKVLGWSDTQVVFRFSLFQIISSIITLYYFV